MIAVSFRDRRFEFLQWASLNVFPFEEVYDLDLIEGKYDKLITDIQDIPETFTGKVIYVGSSPVPSTVTRIESFSQLKEHIHSVESCIGVDNVSRKDAQILTYVTQTSYYETNKSSIIVATLPVSQDDIDMFRDSVPEPEPVAAPKPVAVITAEEPESFEINSMPEPMDIPEPTTTVYTAQQAPQTYPMPHIPQPLQEQPVMPQERPTSHFQQAQRSDMYAQSQIYRRDVTGSDSVMPIHPNNQSLAPLNVQTTSMPAVRRASRASLARSHSQVNISRVGNVAAFFGVTPKTGVSGMVYMLASYLANIDPSKQILVIDLDINQPGLSSMLINGFHLDPTVDTNVINMASLPDNDLSTALNSLVYELQLDPLTTEYSHIHCIFNTNITFADKRALSGWDFSTRIQQLSMYYDYVLVDCGRLQSTANYQLYMLRSNFQKIFVASGMTHASIHEFVSCLTGMNIDYKVVLNRTNRNITGAAIQRNLGKDITATIPNIVSIESLIRQGRTANSLGDRGFLANLDQLRDGLGF